MTEVSPDTIRGFEERYWTVLRGFDDAMRNLRDIKEGMKNIQEDDPIKNSPEIMETIITTDQELTSNEDSLLTLRTKLFKQL